MVPHQGRVPDRGVLVTEWGFEPGSKELFGGIVEEFGEPFVHGFLEARRIFHARTLGRGGRE